MMTNAYTSLFGAWSRASSRAIESYLAANRAAMAAIGDPAGEEEFDFAGLMPPTNGSASSVGTVAAEDTLDDWSVELDADSDDLAVGDSIRFSKTLSESDVQQFAAVSGDTNPLHLDEDAAAETRFGGRIVHGALVTGLISAALARLPGTVVYLSQDTEFRAPVRIGDRVTAEVDAVENLGGERFRLRTRLYREDDLVVDGEAVVLIE
jgi:acyl dehydratase